MTTKTISPSILQRRVNRALAHHGQVLRKCREGSRYYHERGDYYCVDLETSGITETHVDLVGLAREQQVLRPLEILSEPEQESRAARVDGTVTDKDFFAIARQMNKEQRERHRRINELTKKDKYGGLGAKERRELHQLNKESNRKGAEDALTLARLSGLFK